MNSELKHCPGQNSRVSEIMSKHTTVEIIAAIQVPSTLNYKPTLVGSNSSETPGQERTCSARPCPSYSEAPPEGWAYNRVSTVSLQEFRAKRDAIKDLYARTANTRDPNELLIYLMELSSDVLALVPGLEYMIHASPGNKYWHANLMTLLISELHRANDIWELADNQLGEINETSTCDTVPSST